MEKRSERELDFSDNKFVFEDMETGAELEVMPAQIREDYIAKVEEHTKKFKMACSEFEIDYEEMDTESGFDKALLAYLNKRRRLG